MIKKLLFLFFAVTCSSLFSQVGTINDLKNNTLKNSIRLNYISVNQPVDKVTYELKPKMGFIGLNYNIPLNNWLYVGAGIHGAVTGDQGGLFTLGVNLGVNKQLYKNLYVDANVHFGGGGGYRTLVNGGGIIYPNLGLQYKLKNVSFGVQYGYVNFFTGIQKSDNVSFFIEIPSIIRSAPYEAAQKEFTIVDNYTDAFWIKPAVKSVQQVTFDFLFPYGASRKDASQNYVPVRNTLALLGFEYQRYLSKNTFIYAHTDAMYYGLVAGFMDLFIGAGQNFDITENIHLFGKLGIGLAGGRIFPENGLTFYPSIGADIKITQDFGVSGHVGYHRAVGGTFEATAVGFSLKYYGLSGGTTHPFTGEKKTTIRTKGVQIGVENQTYFNVAKFGIPNSDLQLIAIRPSYDLTKNIYLMGEASFAYEGESGGYAHGIFIPGIKSNPIKGTNFSAFAELGMGVAGGGRVDSGEGVIVRPVIGINYNASNALSFHISGGKLISPFGNVNSTNVNIGLSYGLSILSTKK